MQQVNPISLNVEQQKYLYDALYVKIFDLLSAELKNDLVIFTEEYRQKNLKGVIMLTFINIKSMLHAVKMKFFNYQWVPYNQAIQLQQSDIHRLLITMDPQHDCIVVCNLSLTKKHNYMNCIKIKNIC